LGTRSGLDAVEANKNYRNSIFLQAQLEGTYTFGSLDKATEEEWLHLMYVGFHLFYLKVEIEFNSKNLRF
jgi:hypothetical protein